MSVSCELCREHLGEVLEAEIRQAASPLNSAPSTLPTAPFANASNGSRESSTTLSIPELSTAELEAISSHIENCAQCARELGQMRAIYRTFRALPAHSAPANLRQRVRARLESVTQSVSTNSSALAIAPVRSSARTENLWQRTRRGWGNVWNRPARTAWMGGSLALGAFGIFLIARFPEWSAPATSENALIIVQDSNAANSPSNNQITSVPGSTPNATPNTTATNANAAAPKTSAVAKSSASKSADSTGKASHSENVTPPRAAPAPNFPKTRPDEAPSAFVAPPLPDLPPVRRINPRLPGASAEKPAPRKQDSANAASKTAEADKQRTSSALPATARPRPTSAATSDAVMPDAATPVPKTSVPKNVVTPKITARLEVQRDTISLRVTPLKSTNLSAQMRVAEATGPSGPAGRGGASPPSVGGFLSSSQGSRSAASANSAAANSNADSASDTAASSSKRNIRTARTSAPENGVEVASSSKQAREVTIEVLPPRDLSKARLLVTLAPDWQFSNAATNATSQDVTDATLEREVWQGKATSGQPVRVSLAIQPHFALSNDTNGATLRAGRTPLVVELWDMSGPTRKLVASRRLELAVESNEKTDKSP